VISACWTGIIKHNKNLGGDASFTAWMVGYGRKQFGQMSKRCPITLVISQ
jgi:hypothetical protein